MPGSALRARALGGGAQLLRRQAGGRRGRGAVDQRRECARDPPPRAGAPARVHGCGGGRTMACENPIGFETLVAYWLGEVPEKRAATLEEHLLGCAHCTKRLEWLAALAAGVRAAVQDGKVSMVVSEPFVDAMKQAGLRLREYQLEPG